MLENSKDNLCGFVQFYYDWTADVSNFQLFHDGRPYHIETNLLICRPNSWTGF